MSTPSDSGSRAAPPSALVGGPIYRLYHRYAPGLPSAGSWIRLVAVPLVAWVPVALLSWRGAGHQGMPFLLDLEVHLKLLVALPVLALADRLTTPRLANAVRQFEERELVTAADRPRLAAAVARTLRWRDSLALELIVLAVVYTVGHWIWSRNIALDTLSWYAAPSPAGPVPTLAGLWYVYVSAPIFRFLLFLWYARLVLWFALLVSVSRLELRLTATHPDRAGGLGFVGNSLLGFTPLLFAQGVLLAGMIADRIFHGGRTLAEFKLEMAGLVALALGMLLAPLLVFSPHLVSAKRRGLREYGALASRYVQEFDRKWIRSTPGSEPLVGTADLQSLADLGNSYAVVREMRSVPFGAQTVYRLAAAVVVPLLPLALTAFPAEELLERLLRVLL